MNQKNSGKSNSILDIVKFFCSILILGSHALPLTENQTFNLLYGQWFFRFCVPLFFVSSGFYYARMERNKRIQYIKRIAVLYIGSTILYLPLIIMNAGIIKNLIFGYQHLWYLSALVIALLLLGYFIDHHSWIRNNKIVIFVGLFLIIIGALTDEYYRLFNDNEVLYFVVEIINYLGTSRHALFFGLPLVLIGYVISRCYEQNVHKVRRNMILFLISFVFSYIEFCFLRENIGNGITCDVTLINWIPAVFLFQCTLDFSEIYCFNNSRVYRKCADVIYIVHLWIIIILGHFALYHMSRFICASIISVVISIFFIYGTKLLKK